jgi:DnaJ-class molecular chaperone
LLTFLGLARPVEVNVPGGTSSHSTLVVSSCGLQDSSQVGDHILRTVIRVPSKLSWRQWRLARKFAALERPEGGEGTVEGLEADMDHKYTVNVVEPDKKVNSILEQRKKVREEQLSFSDQIRRRLGWSIRQDFKTI